MAHLDRTEHLTVKNNNETDQHTVMYTRSTWITKKTKCYLRTPVRKSTEAVRSPAYKQRQTSPSYYTPTPLRKVDQTTKHRNIRHKSYSSSVEDYHDDSYVTGREDMNLETNIVPFHSRPDGPPHIELRSIKPANTKFGKLMSYRSQRLMITTVIWLSRDTAEVRDHPKNLNLDSKNNVLDWK